MEIADSSEQESASGEGRRSERDMELSEGYIYVTKRAVLGSRGWITHIDTRTAGVPVRDAISPGEKSM